MKWKRLIFIIQGEGVYIKPMPLGCTALCRPMRGLISLSKLSIAQLRPHPYWASKGLATQPAMKRCKQLFCLNTILYHSNLFKWNEHFPRFLGGIFSESSGSTAEHAEHYIDLIVSSFIFFWSFIDLFSIYCLPIGV